jgi:hypothetical protein
MGSMEDMGKSFSTLEGHEGPRRKALLESLCGSAASA